MTNGECPLDQTELEDDTDRVVLSRVTMTG